MALENEELVRRWVEAVNAGRVPEEILAPNFVMQNVTTAVTDRTYSGPSGFHQWMDDMMGVLAPGWLYEVDVAVASEDWVIAKITLRGRGRVSGLPIDLTHWGVLWITEGKATRAAGFPTKRDALAAAGISG